MKKVKVSACLITKNEEMLLEKCLNSLINVVDEIIILDTGSTDRTLEICREFNSPLNPLFFSSEKERGPEEWTSSFSPSLPAPRPGERGQGGELKLYQTTWQNDFAAARNQCISYATGDWILSIDADESLSEKTQEILPGFITEQPQDQPLILEFKITAPVPGNDYLFANPYYKGSLFRNGFGIRFKNPIHEQLTAEHLVSVKCPFLEIYHYEFLKPPEALQKKQAEYAASLQAVISETTDINQKCFYWLTLAHSYCLSGDSDNALKTYFLAHQAYNVPEMDNRNEIYLSVLEGISNELIFRKGDYLRALKYINKLLEIKPDSVTAFYLLGYSQHFTGLFNDAVSSFEKALNFVKNPDLQKEFPVPYDDTVHVNILCELARCRINLGNDAEGLKLLEEVLEIVPQYYRALLYLEKYYLIRKNLPGAVFYHLQNDLNYTDEQKSSFKRISALSPSEPEYNKLWKQMLKQLEKLPGWTDTEKYEMEDIFLI
jgi:glycosyltransferase involved in cell wall biosynthesis